MSNPVVLSVHRNTREQRKRKLVRNSMKRAVAETHKDISPTGYALVAWDNDHHACAYWECGNVPTSVLTEFVSGTLRRRIAMIDAENILTGPGDGDAG